MIPLKDNIPARTTPVVNYGVIAICAVVFLAQLVAQSPQGSSLVERYGMIPARVFHPDRPVTVPGQVLARDPFSLRSRIVTIQRELAEPPFAPWLTLLTCIFLHGNCSKITSAFAIRAQRHS